MTDDLVAAAIGRVPVGKGEPANTPPVFAQIAQFRPLRSDAYEALREAILLGRLRAGERVVEAEIARQMGISRGPIREAVRQLEQDGLVEYQPRRGVVVATLSHETVQDAYAVRAELDGFAARIAIPNITDQHLVHLDGLIESMRQRARADDAEGLLRADVVFHQYIYTVAGNRVLLRLWMSLGPQAWTLFSGAQLRGYSLMDLVDLHPPIVEALRTRDADFAERTAREHMQHIARNVLDHLDETALSQAPGALRMTST